MKKLIILLGVIVFLITLLGTGTAIADGPYKAVDKNPNLYNYDYLWKTALDLKTNPGGDFVQWFRDDHYICQCTDGINPDAIASKISEGWFIWHPAESDPRYLWCSEYIIKME